MNPKDDGSDKKKKTIKKEKQVRSILNGKIRESQRHGVEKGGATFYGVYSFGCVFMASIAYFAPSHGL